jgi:putative tricarboxylic transport membrane protein
MSVLVGGFFMVGIIPGIDLVRDHLDLVFALLMGLAVANIMAGAMTLAITRPLARIAFINMDYLFPIIIVIIFVAAFVTQGAILDLVVAIAAGLLGICMKTFGYSLGALTLGFVLGKLLEKYLLGSLAVMGPMFFLRPIPIVIILIIGVIYSYRPLMKVLRKGRREHAN